MSHLSGDGERLEEFRQRLLRVAQFPGAITEDDRDAFRDLASRLSSEDSSGVVERVWLIRVKNVLEPKALLCMDAEQAQGWRETGAEVIAYEPVLTPPDSTTRLSEGSVRCSACGFVAGDVNPFGDWRRSGCSAYANGEHGPTETVRPVDHKPQDEGER